MIMGNVEGDALEWAIRQGISFFILDFHRLERALTIAKRLDIPARYILNWKPGCIAPALRENGWTRQLS